MEDLQALIGKQVQLDISGKRPPIRGTLIDVGNDIFVIYNNEEKYLYLPFIHVQCMKVVTNPVEIEIAQAQEPPFTQQIEELSYRKVLMNAKGIFLELYVIGKQSIYGYITAIMNDYFVFYSPIYHTLIIPLHHLKYLIPYHSNITPYSLGQNYFLLNPSNMTLARSFDQQLKKLEGKLVVLDLGENTNKIGMLKKIANKKVELITANEESVFIHIDHIKTVHFP